MIISTINDKGEFCIAEAYDSAINYSWSKIESNYVGQMEKELEEESEVEVNTLADLRSHFNQIKARFIAEFKENEKEYFVRRFELTLANKIDSMFQDVTAKYLQIWHKKCEEVGLAIFNEFDENYGNIFQQQSQVLYQDFNSYVAEFEQSYLTVAPDGTNKHKILEEYKAKIYANAFHNFMPKNENDLILKQRAENELAKRVKAEKLKLESEISKLNAKLELINVKFDEQNKQINILNKAIVDKDETINDQKETIKTKDSLYSDLERKFESSEKSYNDGIDGLITELKTAKQSLSKISNSKDQMKSELGDRISTLSASSSNKDQIIAKYKEYANTTYSSLHNALIHTNAMVTQWPEATVTKDKNGVRVTQFAFGAISEYANNINGHKEVIYNELVSSMNQLNSWR